MRKAANSRKPKHKARRKGPARPPAHVRAAEERPTSRATKAVVAGELGRRFLFSAPASLRKSLGAFASDLVTRCDDTLNQSAKNARSVAHWVRHAPAGWSRAIPLTQDDREIAALLIAPFFILAAALAGSQSLQLGRHFEALIARPVPSAALPRHPDATRQIILRPVTSLSHTARLAEPTGVVAAALLVTPPGVITTVSTQRHNAPDVRAAKSASVSADIGPGDERMAVIPDTADLAAEVRPGPLDSSSPLAVVGLASPALAVATVSGSNGPEVPAIDAQAFMTLSAFDEDWRPPGTRPLGLLQHCTLPAASQAAPRSTPASTRWLAPKENSDFGTRLAAAARRQLDEFVVYNAAYRRISYPRGDVSSLFGVCTDVVIRAYRDLGIDLQVAVQQARVGSGDRNIDHRRTETLRRFFGRAGTNLPVTTFAEDYLPGDIVTYARPQNTGPASRSHIAIVSDVIAQSGRPLIIHNRGWGPQLEDALFVDRITGHYRYAGADRTTPAGETARRLDPHELTGTTLHKPVRRARSARATATGRTVR